ncbi:mechanosensitive ion channel family protein [Thermodesulfobacteriota bacterium]
MYFRPIKNRNDCSLLAVTAIIFLLLMLGEGICREIPEKIPNNKKTHADQIVSIEKTIVSEKEELFKRKSNFSSLFSFKKTGEEINGLGENLLRLFSKDFWTKEIQAATDPGGLLIVSSLLAYGIILLVILRFQRFCQKLKDHPAIDMHPARSMAFRLISDSLPLFGAATLLDIYARIQLPEPSAPIIRVVIGILWILLITGWHLDLLKLMDIRESGQDPNRLLPPVRIPLLIIRYVAVSHLLITWLVGGAGVILLFVRILFELTVLIWIYRYYRKIRDIPASIGAAKSGSQPILHPFGIFFGCLIAGGALMLDLTGYGSLSVYWLSSWVRCSVVLLWGGIFYFILKEWHSSSQKSDGVIEEGDKITGNPFRWLIMCLCWLAWFMAIASMIIIAWGGRQTIVIGFFKALNHPFAIGNMQLRLSGFIYALLIIMLTHAAIRLWKRFFQSNILAYSGLDTGLQESIVTISVYVCWGLGIIVAFHAFGLNTTSLTVALGALGIGLGFGLQNIFNNFVSGIILLFERPIQVGDSIQIKDTWASVKKINVRSTVVQTWDNASLIIPNSEFISTQVTNWSFTDMRLRRNIDVGVAYGSDIELVRKTLLEIAVNTPNARKYPEPSVLFTDFGDSALIFRLRVWTIVDNMLTVETAIRFEIDRLFRERGITIAFPQRDLHIRTIADTNGTEKKRPEGKQHELE